ncbi:hypothetical protein KY290_006420 [Solanum tuberosum]|uniref:Uncharacterized protein n=1 Tax=Solanum tuberosum TaxID=4113 RepID=A0ABQ7WGX9_SOLTU|nr:hypothetical protein KY290_019097 [Solanum tuberosum]KAH0779993.1 hypothetical protein KY290_006420 [Solanum tuberosum]
MLLYPSAMLDDQFNTLSESLKVLQESMKELQANNKRMLSSICYVRSLLQEEMRLDSTFTATPEILDDKTITSVLESACDDNDTEIADTLEFSRLSFSVKELTFPVKGYGHKLDMEFDCKVFDIMRKRDIFAEFLGPHTAIGSLGLHICDWFDTGQAFGACFDKVKYPHLPLHTRCLLICWTESLVHMIKCLQLPFDPGVYVTHEVIFLCDMCNDIRSIRHIEYPCITANHAVGVVSSGASEKYIDAYDFIQYFYFCNFNLSWQPYTTGASSHGDNSFIVLGLLEQLNTIGEVPVNLWYRSDVAINRTIGVLRSGNWPGNDINQRAGVSFVCDVLNDDLQYEKWYNSVFGPAPPTGLNHLQLSNGHSIVEWVDDCLVVVLWIIFASCIRLFYGLMSLGYPVTTILKRSSHIFSDAKCHGLRVLLKLRAALDNLLTNLSRSCKLK